MARPWDADRMTQETLPAAGSYTLDPESTTIRCDCKAMFGLFTVHGTFRLSAGEVTIAADAGQSAVRATIDAASYDSGNKTRDADVTSATLLDAKAFPEITFTGSGVRQEGTDWVLSGSVTAHGITQAVPLLITQPQGEAGRFLATATLDRTAFGVTKKKGMVGNTVHLTIDARFSGS
jgi:polyisoprenoid-binding protein YceI